MGLSMYDYYTSQPEYMKSILENREAYLGAFAPFCFNTNPDRLYLCGSGTSFHACAASQAYMQAILGVETTAIAPSRLGELNGERPLVIAVSQGGRSTNTVAAIENLSRRGIPVATLTYSTDTPVARAGGCMLTLGVGDETAGPKTRGYTGTVLSLYLMALAAGLAMKTLDENAHARRLQAIAEVVSHARANQQACKVFYDRHFSTLQKANSFMFAGKGVSAQVAGEMALKEQETLCYPASGYEFEEYLHGPGCCTDSGTALFLMPAGDMDDERMRRLATIVGAATENVYFISYSGPSFGERDLRLQNPDPAFLAPFSTIFFAQLLSALMPEATGRGRHPAVKNIFAMMDTKVPLDKA